MLGVTIAIGIYIVLWGKAKDPKISTHTSCSIVHSNSANQIEVDDIEVASNPLISNNHIIKINMFEIHGEVYI